MPVSAPANGSLSADRSGFLNGDQRREDAPDSLRIQALIVVHVHVHSQLRLDRGDSAATDETGRSCRFRKPLGRLATRQGGQ